MRPHRPLHAAPSIARRAAVALLALGAAVGCAAPSATPDTAPRPVARPESTARDPLLAPWTISDGPGTWTQRVQLVSTLETRVDTVVHLDSTRAELEASWSRLAGSPGGISGLVRAYRVGRGALEPDTIAGLLLPVAFRAHEGPDGTQVRFDVPPSGPCAISLAVVQPLRDVFVRPPARLEPGTTWSDSATYTICRDSIPLEVVSRRTFVVHGAERHDSLGFVVLVDRTSEVRLQGEGLQFGEPIRLTAEGRGTMRLAVLPRGGVVVGAEGEHVLEMQMRGRRRSQDLTQRTRITITP